MDDVAASGALPGESPAQGKARLRRERRAAKIQESGASRLQKITQLQGGSHRDVEKDVPVKPTPSASPAPAAATPDPDEVDISQHFYQPATQMRQPSPFDGSMPPFPAAGQASDPAAEPMFAMLQQLMASGDAAGAPGQDMPPGLGNLLSAMQGGGAGPSQPSTDQSLAWVWRLLHSLFSLALAIYIVLQTPFSGSKLSRDATPNEDWPVDSSPAETFRHFFYLFATFEVVLQSTRFFVERGQLQGGGWLNTIGQFLPEPYSGYVHLIGRYGVIYSTVVSDAMVVVFVLGVSSWLRGGAPS